MSTAVLIYPHQLYDPHPAVDPERLHVLIEDPLFFGDPHHPARFHQMKLILHRASMRRYQREKLEAQGLRTRYMQAVDIDGRIAWPLEQLAEDGVDHVLVVDPTDYLLERRLRRHCERLSIRLEILPTPNFIASREDLDAFWQGRDDYHQTDFYIYMRRRMGLLLDKQGKPEGGRWTYDTENRQKLKAGVKLAPEADVFDNADIREARTYVARHFGENPGQTQQFIWPTSHAEAEAVLKRFLTQRLDQFGPYQDAISRRGGTLFHSLISSSLNMGLLSPMQVVDALMAYYDEHPQTSLASVEGFLRQVIGWREFIRAVYLREGTRQRTDNFFGHQRAIDERWYRACVGVEPVDDAIRKADRYAYAHHIERLMILGNFMLLCEIHPDEVYRWFMEMFIDAYDWVMVPNVYGMSQYADGGLMTTKPYISGSNYIRKMSDYSTGDWSEIWDGLYWRFIAVHEDFFRGNPRLSIMPAQLQRMDDERRERLMGRASDFLRGLDG